MASSMSRPLPKRFRRNKESPSLKSTQSRKDIVSPWVPGRHESQRRVSTRIQPSSIPSGAPTASIADFPTDPAGFFANDTDHSNNLRQDNLNPQVLDKDPTIEKISIAVDFGTENSAVTYMRHWEGENLRPRPGRDQILEHIESVSFKNRSSYVKTQIGWHSDTLQILYGYEVDDAIRRGKLLRGSQIRGLKLTLLDPSDQTRAERSSLEAQIEALPQTIRLVQDRSEPRLRLRRLTPEDLISKFIGYLIRHCLHQIHDMTACSSLQWPKGGPETASGDLDPAIVAKVVVYIAVPSLATPEFVDLIIAATQRAGFSDAIVAPEPACAQQLLLQIDFENHRGRNGNPYSGASIILDIGGGTADLQTMSIVKYNPTEIKEEVLGEGGFFGGRYANSLFREHAEGKIGNQKDWLVSQICYPGYEVEFDEILDHLEAEFEKHKQEFDDRAGYFEYDDLSLPGRAFNLNRPDRGLVGSAFRLSRDAYIEIFTKQAEKLIGLIDKQIRLFQDRIRRILLVGGCSHCFFLRKVLKDHYEIYHAAGYSIEVIAPENDTTLTIAKGALLAGLDENFVTERVLRRSYGIHWERAVKQLRDPKTPHQPKYDPYDKVFAAREMSKFLLKIGQRVHRQFSAALSNNYETSEDGHAWRGIPVHRKHPTVKLTEEIIFSDHVNHDDLWIGEPSHKMSLPRTALICKAGTIVIRLTLDDCQAFEVRRVPHKSRYFYYVEYEVIIHGDGLRMTYEFVIPRTGKFERGGYGENPIRKTCTLNLAPAVAFYSVPDDRT